MKHTILIALSAPILACAALASSEASSWIENEHACMRAVAEANRVVLPPGSPDIWPLVLLLALLLAVSAPGLAALTRAGLDAARAFGRDTTRPAFLAGLILVTAVVYCGAGKFPTNPVTEMIGTLIGQFPDASGGEASQAVSGPQTPEADPAALGAGGVALVSATNALPGWWERPAWAEAYGPWSQYGVHEDFFGLRLADTAAPSNSALITLASPPFPVGTNAYNTLFISSCGAASFGQRCRLWPDSLPVPDGSSAPLLAILKGPLGMAPGTGGFWYGSLSNRLLLTWRDVLLSRDATLAASAQAVLEPTGDFLLRVKLPSSGLPPGFATAAQNNGGGHAFTWDSNALALAASPGGIEIRGRGFGFLPPGDESGDTDGDGLPNLAEIAGTTHPLRPDSDFDGLDDGAETAGTDPVSPDSDGDLAADSLDPQPLAFNTDTVLACCTNTWLFHVRNGLAVDGTNCLLAADTEAWFTERFPVTVTLNAAVPPPGAVLRIGTLPLILREPGSHILWLPRSSAQHVWLCRQWDAPVDYTLSSSAPGFIFEPAGASAPQPPFYSGIRYEGVMAVPSPLTVQPTNACFHGKPITFTAVGAATGLSGTYTWTYGYTEIVTNTPVVTFAPPDWSPSEVTVEFMPTLAQPPPQSGGFMLLSAGPSDWPVGGNGPCRYCGRYRAGEHHHDETCGHVAVWCEKIGSEGGCSNSPAYVPPADGTNTWGKYLAVNRRAPAPARPAGGTSFTPNPRGHNGYTLPPPEPGPGAVWAGDHWHYYDSSCSHNFDNSGCCACPEHNSGGGGGGGSSSQPVIFKSSDGVAVAYFSFEGSSWPLSAGGTVHPGGGVYVTAQMPSASPLDRSAVFTRYDPENKKTYYEYDRFTVMGLDLQPDITCDGQISAADSDALALDWNREWLIPANTNAWFPVKIFKDVALPGIYTVTASTNITVRYNGVVLTPGGETVSFPQSQSQETLEVQAAAPGAAALTVSFIGTGTATNYNCSTYVSIKALGLKIMPAEILGCQHCLTDSIFSLHDSYAPNGVTWKIRPQIQNGATLSLNGESVVFQPGSVGTNYFIIASCVDVSDCVATSKVTVCTPGSISFSGNQYDDASISGESHKEIWTKFHPVPNGDIFAEHFVFVQYVKGYMKHPSGEYIKIKMYGQDTF